jgi:hypothetical protein
MVHLIQNEKKIQIEQARLTEKLRLLKFLYPDYTNVQLQESYERLVHYFELSWRIFSRMSEDGTLDRIIDKTNQNFYDQDTKVDSPNN